MWYIHKLQIEQLPTSTEDNLRRQHQVKRKKKQAIDSLSRLLDIVKAKSWED